MQECQDSSKKSSYSGSKSYCRPSVAEDRIKVAEMETISAEKKKATDASTMVATLEERTRKAEDAVKMLQTDAHMSDNRIAELVQKRATRAELQIRDLSARCQHLQEQLDRPMHLHGFSRRMTLCLVTKS